MTRGSKVVVTGASGMLGSQVLRLLLSSGVEAECPLGDRPVDLGDAGLVIHCAALTDVDALEDDLNRARDVNASWPQALANRAYGTGARLIYISTEAVYDGEREGLHSEDEPPHPVNIYGKTKWEGEVRVLQSYPAATVIRTTFIGRSLPGQRRKIAEQVLDHLTAGEPIQLAKDQIFTPLYAGTLARLILRVADMDVPGVLNLGSSDAMSIARFGYKLAQAAGLDFSLIQPVALADMPRRALRSRNTALDVRKAESLLGPMPTVQEGIEELLA